MKNRPKFTLIAVNQSTEETYKPFKPWAYRQVANYGQKAVRGQQANYIVIDEKAEVIRGLME